MSRKIIVPILLLLSAVAGANAQPATDKASSSTISGKVTIGGKGVPGLVVGLSTETRSTSISITRFRGVTDEEGNYRIKNVPPGTYQVMASAAAYVQSDRTSVIVGKNEVVENIDIALSRGGVITGKVIDADGRPVVEEQIYFSANTQSRGLPYLRTVRTDDRGVYRAFGLPPGRYNVSAGRGTFARQRSGHERTYHPSAVNAAEATLIEVNEGTEATNVDITLGRESSNYAAWGRIIDGDTSQPLPNVRIGLQRFFTARRGFGGSSIETAAESTKDGDFKIENLPPGTYAVYFDSQNDSERFSEAVRFEVVDHDVEGLIIKTSKGGSITGMVVLDGPHDPGLKPNQPGDKIFASVANEEYSGTRPSANINPDGSFRLTGLPPGRLILNLQQREKRLRLIRLERDGVVYRNDVNIREREQITGLRVVVSQANGSIRGVLKLPEGVTLAPPARLLISVRKIDDPTVSISPVQADTRGRFLLQGLAAGNYELTVGVVGVPNDRRPTIERATQTVIVTNGAIADVTITVQMPQTGPGGP